MFKLQTKICSSVFILLLFTVLFNGCESRIVENRTDLNSIKIEINTSGASPKLMAIVDQFIVTVSDVKSNQVIRVTPLQFNNPFVVGQIDALPAEVDLRFTAEAINLKTAAVIYSGTTIMNLIANDTTPVLISLSPVVPLLKFTPRRIVRPPLDTFSMDVKMFNIAGLYGVSFKVRYVTDFLTLDSAVLDPSLPLADIIFFQADSVDAFGVYKAISITHTVTDSSIASTAGDAVLAKLFFSTTFFTLPDSTTVIFEPSGVTLSNQSIFPLGSLFTDDALVEFVP